MEHTSAGLTIVREKSKSKTTWKNRKREAIFSRNFMFIGEVDSLKSFLMISPDTKRGVIYINQLVVDFFFF
jgi:hypothetical protein